MKRAIIIHGWEGSPNEGWLPWIKKELENKGWEVEAPQMPNAELPKLSEWLETLRGLVGKPDKDTYFVGHSLGCYAFLKFIEQMNTDEAIGGGVMVAGFAGNLKVSEPVLEEFYESGLDWEKIKTHQGKYTAIYSDRDDYVKTESAQEFADKLGAKLIKDNSWKHFSGSEGIKELPIALKSLEA